LPSGLDQACQGIRAPRAGLGRGLGPVSDITALALVGTERGERGVGSARAPFPVARFKAQLGALPEQPGEAAFEVRAARRTPVRGRSAAPRRRAREVVDM
jgi:hypothetical protein